MNDLQPNADSDPIAEELTAYLDGELDAEQSARVEQRLADDVDYRQRLRQLQQTWDLLDHLPRAEASGTFAQSTLELVTVKLEDGLQHSLGRSGRRSAVWTALAAGVVIAAFAGYVTVDRSVSSGNRRLLEDLPTINRYDMYRNADSVEFLLLLEREEIFTEELDEDGGVAPPELNFGSGTLQHREQQLRTATPEEQEKLRRNGERFYELAAAEQDRLRRLHEAISQHDHAEHLCRILARYNDWLKTLSSAERAKLLGLPIDQRLAMIEQLTQQHEQQRFGFFGESNLPAEDIPKIFAWTMDYIQQHRSEIIEQLTAPRRERILQADPREQQRMLLAAIIQRRGNSQFPLSAVDSFRRLVGQLSPEAQAMLENATGAKKRILIGSWISAAILAKMAPQVDDEKLERFVREKLPQEWRELLDRESADKRRRQLIGLYHFYQRNGTFPPPRAFDQFQAQRLDTRPLPNTRLPDDRLRRVEP